MESRDTVRITFDQNPALQEFCQENDCKPGEDGEAEIKFTFKNIDAEGADLTINALVPEGYEEDEDTEPDKMNGPSGGPMTGNTPSISPAARIVKKST